MNDKDLLIRMKPVQGYNKVFDVGEYNMKLTTFGLIKLAQGTSYSNSTGEMEVALVLMGGNFKAAGDGWSFAVTDGRTSPFTGKPHCLYLPFLDALAAQPGIFEARRQYGTFLP